MSKLMLNNQCEEEPIAKITKEKMIELLKTEHPLNVTILKWETICAVQSVNKSRSRHQFDDGISNCALCYSYRQCKSCPIVFYYGTFCDESIDNKEKYEKDFYAQTRETGDNTIMLNALLELKSFMTSIKKCLVFYSIAVCISFALFMASVATSWLLVILFSVVLFAFSGWNLNKILKKYRTFKPLFTPV